MENIRPNIRQHPLLSRYPGSEYSVGYSPGMLASAYAHDGESTGFYDYMCVEFGLKIEESVQHFRTGTFAKSYMTPFVKKVECWGVGNCYSNCYVGIFLKR